MEYKEIDKHGSHYYTNTPLYYLSNDKYVLYKKEGDQLPWERIITNEVPDKLYIKDSDLKKSTEELFNKLTDNLQEELDKPNGSFRGVVKVMEEIIENMFLNIKSDSMSFAPTIIKKITKSYLDEPNIFKEFSKYVRSNDSLTHHSTRVLFYTLTYCYHNRMDLNQIRKFGLAGLFHAVGKTKLDNSLLENKQLNDDEFGLYKMYPQYSHDILKTSRNIEVKEVANVVLKHKENENQTGFPYGIRMSDEIIEAIGIIESFEQLTSPRRKKLSYFDALKIIREDVEKGKYNKKVFEKFVLCLGTDISS
jgi:HD-GYP domain-containing protein (c-di-GMP phosphodiesterase class II)